MLHFGNSSSGLKSAVPASVSRLSAKAKTAGLRACLIALLVAVPALSPSRQQAQDINPCAPVTSDKCFKQAKRDIAFLLDSTGSVELRGQSYNIQVEGVLRALRDSTVIPRDGSVAVAVILFNEVAQVVVSLTDINSEADAQAIINTVAGLKCNNIHSRVTPCPFGATFYAPAIQAADIDLSRARAANPKPGVRRVFLLSTDGLTNDLDRATQAVESARIASIQAGIPFEMDVILIGTDPQSADFPIAKNAADTLVTPKPATDLPGATLVINPGTANVEGASLSDPDLNRQANTFAELTRTIVRGAVPALQFNVNLETDTAPGAPPVAGANITSLRQAIEQANCNGGAATITFAASLKDKTIKLTAPLPPLVAPNIVINGCAASGGTAGAGFQIAVDDCTPAITIDGGGQISDGIVIRSNRNTIRGLKLINFTRAGIVIGADCPLDNLGHNLIVQNAITGSPNGVVVLGSSGNVRNLISRNTLSRPAPGANAPAAALIDLGGDGPTPNDAGDVDQGPNTLLNFPDSMAVTATDNTVTVTGKLNSPPANGATVEIFAVTGFHTAGQQVVVDGVSFLGEAAVDSKGSFTATGLASSPTGLYTATVTDVPAISNTADPSANTSELMLDSASAPLPRPTADVTASVAFGNVNLNTPQTQTVTLNNPGTAPLTVSGCAIVLCSARDDVDNRSRFVVTNCPTGRINPGQSATLNVTFTPNFCGQARACLQLQTDDPLHQQVLIELTGIGAGGARAVAQDGITSIRFKKTGARGTPRSNPPSSTFTITNPGCATLTLTSATFTRGGQLDDSGVFKIIPQGSQTSFPLTIGAGNSVTFTVQFNPVIPKVGGTPPRVKDLLPDSIADTLTIQASAGNPVVITVSGTLKKGVRLIKPDDPSIAPLVTLCRSGNEFTVEFSAWDSNTNVTRAVYQFRNGSNQPLGAPITVDNLDQALAARGIQRGQSFTVTQRFTGAVDNDRVASVEVTVFDGEGAESATSGPVSTNCSSALQATSQATPATVMLPTSRSLPSRSLRTRKRTAMIAAQSLRERPTLARAGSGSMRREVWRTAFRRQAAQATDSASRRDSKLFPCAPD